MAKIIKHDEPFERLEEPRDKAVADLPRPGPDAQGRAHRDGPGRPADAVVLSPGRVHRPVPRPAHSQRRRDRRVQAAVGRRRLLERRRLAAAVQRLYATAWFSQEELDEHLQMVEEAKRRDHRVLGKQLELFAINPLVGPGLILWLPKGAIDPRRCWKASSATS